MNNLSVTFALLVLCCLGSWTLVALCVYQAWDRRKRKTPHNRVLGYVEAMMDTPDGVIVQGKFNNEGMKVFDEGKLEGMNIGFELSDAVVQRNGHGVSEIKQARLQSVSLVADPLPGQGTIDWVGTQPKD